ncbi:hypothetical protein [Arthrobacter sp. HY1533]|uniref:hypothetical protein n=1 Tax=Arthrobacter sp. HY1533 TaxID=2970919 RepID=UPI0022B9E2F2|nr:hypothetical protein [Arthrobacter sp. HY1533]
MTLTGTRYAVLWGSTVERSVTLSVMVQTCSPIQGAGWSLTWASWSSQLVWMTVAVRYAP